MATRKQRALREQKMTHRQRRQHGRLKARRDRQIAQREQELAGPLDTGYMTFSPEVHAAVEQAAAEKHAANSPSMKDLVDEVVPARAPCPSCHFSQKVRKDGTMGSHKLYGGLGEDGRECPGTGMPWTTASPA